MGDEEIKNNPAPVTPEGTDTGGQKSNSGMPGWALGVQAGADPLHKIISGGYTTKVGGVLDDVGSGLMSAGAASGNPWLILGGGIAKTLSAGANRLWGSKAADVAKYNQATQTYNNIGFKPYNLDQLTAQLNNMPMQDTVRRSSYGILNSSDYNRQTRRYNQAFRNMENRAYHAANTASQLNTFNQLRNQSAYGGPMMFGPDFMDVSTPIGYQFASDNAALQRQKYNNKFTAPMFSLGGGFSTHGSDFTNHLIHVDAGGTHEGNPNEGVPMGTDGQGGQNLVEEGETVYRSNILGEGGYVFSERLYVPKFDPKQYKQYEVLPYEAKIMKKYGGYTFAEASKKAEKDAFGIKGKDSNSAGNVGDSISKQMNNKVQEVLKQLQEQEREKERLQQMQEAIAQMSPEQREQMAMLMQQQQAAQEQAYQQQMAQEMGAIPQEQDQEAEELVDYRDPRSNPLTDGRIQQAIPEEAMGALGGYLYGDGGPIAINKFDKGGPWEKLQRPLDYLIADYLINHPHEQGTLQSTVDKAADQTEDQKEKAEKAVRRYYRRNKINPNNVNQGLLQSDIERYLQTGDFASLEINNYKLNGRVSSTRTQELNNLPQVKHRDLISQLNQLPLDENGNYVLSDARNLVRANDYSLKDNRFVGKDGVAVDPTTAAFLFSDAIKQPIQSAIDSTTGKPYFANQDELTRYYRDQLYPFFDKIGFKGVGEKPERGENYLTDEDYWNKALDYYVHGHLNKENLNKFIGELEKGDEKQKYLAEIIRNNVNFDYTGKLKPNQVKESDAYIKAVKDANAEARTKGEKEPFDEAKATDSYIGQKHPPLLAAQQAVEQNAPEVRRVLMGLDANGELDPNVIYQNYDWNSNALGLNYAEPTHIIPAPEGADSGYITQIYGVGPQKVNNNIIKIGDQWYSIPEGMEGQFKSQSNPKEKLNVTSPNTIEHTENYYTLDDNAPADTNDIAMRKQSIVPAIAQAGLGAIGGLASILLNKERPIKQISVPITKTRNFHPVEVLPDYVDRNFTTNKLIAQGNAGIRQAVNLSGGNSGVARAAALANNANLLNSIGEADYKGWLQNIQNRLEADKLNMSQNLEYDKLNTQIDSDYNNNLIKLAGLNANFIDAQNKLNWQRSLEMQKGIGAGLSTIGAAINRFDETDFRNWYDYWYLKSGAYRGANGGR